MVASRPAIRHEAKQAPRGEMEVQSMRRGTLLKNLGVCIQAEVWGMCLGWILKVWGDGWRNMSLNQAEFIDTGPLSRELCLKWKLTWSKMVSKV